MPTSRRCSVPDRLSRGIQGGPFRRGRRLHPRAEAADPAHFGIGLATIDGHVYEVGDSAVPFTIQSVSKAFVFALALEMLGAERVAAAIGVEPSGEAFNSIRLTNDNRPFNPMVNAGAIACSGSDLKQATGAAPSSASAKSSAGSPAASSTSTRPCTHPNAHRQPQSRDRLAAAQLLVWCRATSMRCSTSISANARCW